MNHKKNIILDQKKCIVQVNGKPIRVNGTYILFDHVDTTYDFGMIEISRPNGKAKDKTDKALIGAFGCLEGVILSSILRGQPSVRVNTIIYPKDRYEARVLPA